MFLTLLPCFSHLSLPVCLFLSHGGEAMRRADVPANWVSLSAGSSPTVQPGQVWERVEQTQSDTNRGKQLWQHACYISSFLTRLFNESPSILIFVITVQRERVITKRECEGEENEQNVLTQTSNSPFFVPNKSSDIWSCVFHVYFSQSADSHSVSGLHQSDSSFSQHKLGGKLQTWKHIICIFLFWFVVDLPGAYKQNFTKEAYNFARFS